jgi:hypothetical protein
MTSKFVREAADLSPLSLDFDLVGREWKSLRPNLSSLGRSVLIDLLEYGHTSPFLCKVSSKTAFA